MAKRIFLLILLCLPLFVSAQQGYNGKYYITKSLRVSGPNSPDSTATGGFELQVDSLANNDTTYFLQTDSKGRFFCRKVYASGGGGGTTYTEGWGINISGTTIFIDSAQVASLFALQDTGRAIRAYIASTLSSYSTTAQTATLLAGKKDKSDSVNFDGYVTHSKLKDTLGLKANYTDTAGMLANYASAIAARVKYTDTAAMLLAYHNYVLRLMDSVGVHRTAIDGRVKYTDTAGMLAAYQAAVLALQSGKVDVGSNDYIKNQTATTQTADYKINGNGTAARYIVTGSDSTTNYDSVLVKKNGVFIAVPSDSAYIRVGGNKTLKSLQLGSKDTFNVEFLVNNQVHGRLLKSGNWQFGSVVATDNGFKATVQGTFLASTSINTPTYFIGATGGNQSITGSSATGNYDFVNGSGAGWQYRFFNGGSQKIQIDASGLKLFTVNTYASGGYGYLVKNTTSNYAELLSSIPSTDISGISSYQLISKYVVNQSLSGTVNGSNMVFTIPSTPVTGTVEIFANGVLQISGYAITSGTTVTFDWAPPTGYVLTCKYLEL